MCYVCERQRKDFDARADELNDAASILAEQLPRGWDAPPVVLLTDEADRFSVLAWDYRCEVCRHLPMAPNN